MKSFDVFFEKANQQFTSQKLSKCMVTFRKQVDNNEVKNNQIAFIICAKNDDYGYVNNFSKKLMQAYTKAVSDEKNLLKIQNFFENQNIRMSHFAEDIGNKVEDVYAGFKDNGLVNNMQNVFYS